MVRQVPPRKYMNKALVKNEKKKTEYVRINFKIARGGARPKLWGVHTFKAHFRELSNWLLATVVEKR